MDCTDTQLYAITHRRRPSAQVRALRAMGIEHKVRPDGTVFVDVLSNADGRVFEQRVREKDGGEWKSYVHYRDRSAYPKGYAGLKGQTCIECHQQAGTGGYGVGLVPGGDGVISDKIPALEP